MSDRYSAGPHYRPRTSAAARRATRRPVWLVTTAGIMLGGGVAFAAYALWVLPQAGGGGSTTGFSSSLEATVTTSVASAYNEAESAVALTSRLPLEHTPVLGPAVSIDRILEHTERIVGFGVRTRGTEAERAAADYIAAELAALGYEPRVEEFRLPEGTTSRNVIVRLAGSDPRVIVLGAHIDSKAPAPGANDNAVSCGLLLELARTLRDAPVTPAIELVFFGSEEYKKGAAAHHLGSRFRVASMSAEEKRRVAGMLSIDMIAVGAPLYARTMGKGPLTLSDAVLAEAHRQKLPMSYKRDPGTSGWSDHEPYELEGIPVVWIERPEDPAYHTAGDTTRNLERHRLQQVTDLVVGFLEGLDASGLDALGRRAPAE